MVKELQDIALNVFLFTSQHQIHLNVSWLPRDQNSQAAFLSKIVDFDDYSLHDEVFFHLENLWGPHSVDRFACSYNAKLPRFNSRFVQPGAEAVDAFTQDWPPENNWLVPPISLIGRVLKHMSDCKALTFMYNRWCRICSRLLVYVTGSSAVILVLYTPRWCRMFLESYMYIQFLIALVWLCTPPGGVTRFFICFLR